MPCPQPYNWCDGAGEVSDLFDCGDGDGIGDWTCVAANTSRRAVLLSTSNCTEHYWPEAPKSMCPPHFNGEKGVVCQGCEAALKVMARYE